MKPVEPSPGTGRSVRYISVGRGRTVIAERIRTVLTLTLTGLVLLALETAPLTVIHMPLPGLAPAAPSLGLLFVMATGFLFGEREGAVAGLIAGWLADASAGESLIILPLLYLVCGYLSGTVGRRRLAHNLPSFAVFAAVGGGVECLFSIARTAISIRDLPPVGWIVRGLLPVWILTVLFSPLVYAILWGERKFLYPKA